MAIHSDIFSVLQTEDVIPDVVPHDFIPTILFTAVWPDEKEANSGNFLAREDTVEEPQIHVLSLSSPEGSTASYTLVMIDPDAPSRMDPKYREFRHWVITGLRIQPVAESFLVVKTQPSTTPYRPPGPRPGSDVHRYTFLLFEEPELDFVVPRGAPEYGAALEERRNWNAMDFGERYGLKLVGANLFLVRAAD